MCKFLKFSSFFSSTYFDRVTLSLSFYSLVILAEFQYVLMLTLFNVLLVGVLYGTTSVTVGHPFDTIKTKMQAQHGFENEGMIRSFVKTVRSQGIKGLYRLVITLSLCFKRLNREVQKEVTFIPFRFKTHLTAFFHYRARRLYTCEDFLLFGN